MPGLSFNPDQDITDLSGKELAVLEQSQRSGSQTFTCPYLHQRTECEECKRNHQPSPRYGFSHSHVISRVRPILPLVVKQATQALIQKEPRLDVLMCNAGIMAAPAGLTPDGYEVQFGTNHLGHAMLIHKCLPLLQQTANAGANVRIIILSSVGFRMHPGGGILFDSLKKKQDCYYYPFGPWIRYGQSKLANLLYARELARRYPGITTVSIHPGVVNTGLVDNLSRRKRAFVHATTMGKRLRPFEGAYNQTWAATTPKENLENGQLYGPVGVLFDSLDRTARDDGLAKRLWEWTDQALRSFVED